MNFREFPFTLSQIPGKELGLVVHARALLYTAVVKFLNLILNFKRKINRNV